MKVLSTTLLGAIASALIFGVGAAVIVIVLDTTSGSWISINNADFWWLAFILGALFGAGVGGFETFIVSFLQIRILWTILFGLAVGVLYLMSFVFDVNAAWDENHQMFMALFVIWQVIYPTIISLISVPAQT